MGRGTYKMKILLLLTILLTGIIATTISPRCTGDRCQIDLDRLDYTYPDQVCPKITTSVLCLEEVSRSCPAVVDQPYSELTAEIYKYKSKYQIHCSSPGLTPSQLTLVLLVAITGFFLH